MTTLNIQIDVDDHKAQQMMVQLKQLVHGQGGRLTVAAERRRIDVGQRDALTLMHEQGYGLTDADVEDWNRMQAEEDRQWEETYRQRYGRERPAVEDL